MSFGYWVDWCVFCAVRIWLYCNFRVSLSAVNWTEDVYWEIQVLVFALRSFCQAGLLNACQVPRDTWSVFKGKQLNHKKRETGVYSSIIALKESYCKLCKSCMAAWVPGAPYVLHPSRDLADALSGLSCTEVSWWLLDALAVNCV